MFIGYFDLQTGFRISFSLFYLIPIILTAWFLGIVPGQITAVFSALTWFWADNLAGHTYAFRLTPYWNALVRLFHFSIPVLIVALVRLLEEEKRLSRTDHLTGIGNKRHFYESANREIERCRRYAHPVTLVYLDCDDFKLVNDRLGHHKGDSLLRAVGSSLKKNTRVLDTACRIGGDEFVVLLPQTGYEGARKYLDRFLDILKNELKDKRFPITCSIGAATFILPPDSAEQMLKEADSLMYSAKEQGKNRIVHNICSNNPPG